MGRRRTVVLYGAQGCHLCDVAKRKIERVRRVCAFELREIDIASDPDLDRRYGHLVPVVAIDGRDALMTKVTEFHLLKALAWGHA